MSDFDIRTPEELPSENVAGDAIEYVWIVYRPANYSDLGRAELLGAHDNPDSAEAHARQASTAGRCKVKAMPLTDGTSPLQEVVEP